jgi:hypothetical protein
LRLGAVDRFAKNGVMPGHRRAMALIAGKSQPSGRSSGLPRTIPGRSSNGG